ncbi:GHMP family kinase ATP-binding protein [Lutispora sp.]|uniref:GHMP family kinase ATP-binding protein n=1 Tax=Lutispora sp. TaxID=2828727 RepID=UPI002B210822|nr:kinase [Lutispora sp.]MEA4960043.1 kinase [Lutispora sp.]
MEIKARYPGSIGEVIQGRIKGIDTLLSCPVNLFTDVRIYECKNPLKKISYPKASQFLTNVLKRWGYTDCIERLDIEICSDIPKGKGFASSTADLCGVYNCLIKLFHRKHYEDELAEECIKVEPTDSIIFKSMTFFDYKTGAYKEHIGSYMKFFLLVFEGNRIVDTIEFNKKSILPLSQIDDLAELARHGAERQSLDHIARASTESIIRNQHRLKYDLLSEVLRLKDGTGGLGIMGAHSGDALAIIYDDIKLVERGFANAPHFKGYKAYKLRTITEDEF